MNLGDVDPFVRARWICEVLGVCRRTLYDYIKDERFPRPDRPQGRHGEPDLWRKRTAMQGIESFAKPAAAPVTRSAPPTRARKSRVRRQAEKLAAA